MNIRVGDHDLPTRSMLAQQDDAGRWWPHVSSPAAGEDDGEHDPAGPQNITIGEWTKEIFARTHRRPRTVSYGKYLFDALFGDAVWREICDRLPGSDVVELALNWPARDTDLHRHVWELAHDGVDFLALRRDRVVAFVRTVGGDGPAPQTIAGVPRLLFVAGSALTDPRIHAGAEFIGLLHGLDSADRRGQRDRKDRKDRKDQGIATVATRLLAEASPRRLADRCAEFQPDLVHIVSHGRWDEVTGRGVVHLRSDIEGAREEPVDAGQLLTALRSDDGRLPTAVLLSVCESGGSPGGPPSGRTSAAPGGGRPPYRNSVSSEAMAPLAALLVEGGVPLVIAMAGRVADSACRMFTRALAAAISKGLPLSEAVARGRRAVSMAAAPGPDDSPDAGDDETTGDAPKENPVDWALPTLFASPGLPPDFPLVNAHHGRELRKLFPDLKFSTNPVFCGREEFFDTLADLLDPDNPRTVLVATGTGGRTGGSRLLQELGAGTLKAGHVPCYVGPFKDDAPRTSWDLGRAIAEEIQLIRNRFELADTVPSATLQEVARLAGAEPGDGSLRYLVDALYQTVEREPIPPRTLARLVRQDLRLLAADLSARHPMLFDEDPQVLLLLDDVDKYEDAIETVFGMLQTTGLGVRDATQLPVALFGRVREPGSQRFADAVERMRGLSGSAQVSRVRLFRDMVEPNRDLLAYRQLLLHPEPDGKGRRLVLVPREAAAEWVAQIRLLADRSTVVYDPNLLRAMESYALEYRRQFYIGDDDDMLRLCGLAS